MTDKHQSDEPPGPPPDTHWSLASLDRHIAVRPAWRCRTCAAPWPCQPAKLRLRREYAHDRAALATYLCVLMHDAIADELRLRAAEVDTAAYFARFIGWTRPGRSSSHGAGAGG